MKHATGSTNDGAWVEERTAETTCFMLVLNGCMRWYAHCQLPQNAGLLRRHQSLVLGVRRTLYYRGEGTEAGVSTFVFLMNSPS